MPSEHEVNPGTYDQDEAPPALPSSLIQLGPGARRVTDADEEVFILYTLHRAPAGRTGLGQVDGHHDVLTIRFDLDSDDFPEIGTSEDTGLRQATAGRGNGGSSTVSGSKSGRNKGSQTSSVKKQSKTQTSNQRSGNGTVEIQLYQDSTSLRSTEGDTGSVVWRSSVRLGACLLRQFHRPPYGVPALFDRNSLCNAKILELGSGTGVLPAMLLPSLQASSSSSEALSATGRWLATDQQAMLHLLRKNANHLNVDSQRDTVTVEELDWVAVSHLTRGTTSTSTYAGGLAGLRSRLLGQFRDVAGEDEGDVFPDIIFAVDCVFNPSLFTPLIDTLDMCCRPKHTLALVVIELRSDDATLEFLQTWLEPERHWHICAVPSEQLGCGLHEGYAAWVGWKE